MPENPDKSAELQDRALQNKARNCGAGAKKTKTPRKRKNRFKGANGRHGSTLIFTPGASPYSVTWKNGTAYRSAGSSAVRLGRGLHCVTRKKLTAKCFSLCAGCAQLLFPSWPFLHYSTLFSACQEPEKALREKSV